MLKITRLFKLIPPKDEIVRGANNYKVDKIVKNLSKSRKWKNNKF